MITTIARSLAYAPLVTRARRALAALFIGGMIGLLAGGDAGALAAPAAPLPDAAARPAAPSETDVHKAAPHFLIAPRGHPATEPRRESLP